MSNYETAAMAAVLGLLWMLGMSVFLGTSRWQGKFPKPLVGQVWRSAHSGRLIRVESVETSDQGTLMVTFAHEFDGPMGLGWGIGQTVYGYDEWCRRLYVERRELIQCPSRGHRPPRPLPAPAPRRSGPGQPDCCRCPGGKHCCKV
jgi:hypothetical protein